MKEREEAGGKHTGTTLPIITIQNKVKLKNSELIVRPRGGRCALSSLLITVTLFSFSIL